MVRGMPVHTQQTVVQYTLNDHWLNLESNTLNDQGTVTNVISLTVRWRMYRISTKPPTAENCSLSTGAQTRSARLRIVGAIL
jgi:hypothetical protein